MSSEPVTVHVPYRVPYADTDRMGVVYYGNYLVYFERARNELLRAVDLTYREIEDRGFGLPVLEAKVSYKTAARYDDLLDISAWLSDCGAVRLRVSCEVRCDGVLLASGHTVHAFVDLRTLRPTRMPADIADVFSRSLGTDGEAPE